MSVFRVFNIGLTACTASLLLFGCQSMPPKDAGTMGEIERSLESPRVIDTAPAIPPAEVSTALLPPIDLHLPAAKIKPAENHFDVNVTSVATRDFLMGLVEGTSYNMVVHPDVSGNISLSLKSVTIPDVMEILRDVYGYEFQRVRNGFHVLPVRLQSRIFQVNYLNLKRNGSSQTRVSSGQVSDTSQDDSGSSGDGAVATSGSEINTSSSADFWQELSASLRAIVGTEKGRSVVISAQSGIVVVRAMPQELREVETFLLTTEDAMHRQVILEAKVIEVELNDGFQSGINWAKIGSHNGNSIGLGQSGSGTLFSNPGSEGVTLPLGGNGSIGTPTETSPVSFTNFSAFGGFFGAVVNTGSFMAFIELLESQGNVQVLSSPRIATLNNQKAVIKVGSDEFFVTDVSSTTVGSDPATTTPDITLTPFFSGIALDVTPQIDQNGRVTLHIHPSVSRVTDQQKIIQVGNQTQNLPLAKSTVRESDSLVYANSGQLVVIGGLMQDTRSEDVTSTPLLGDIPLFGALFRHTRQAAKKSELVIVLRPTVVDSNTWGSTISRNRERIRELDRGFHYGGKQKIFGNLAEPVY